MPLEPYAKEERGERSESTRIARVVFLRLIPQLKPECLAELWSLGFMEFVYVVSQTFKAKLIKTTVAEETGVEIFSYLLAEKYLHIRRDGLINKSIGDLLCLTFSKFHAIDRISIEKRFQVLNHSGRSRVLKLYSTALTHGHANGTLMLIGAAIKRC